MRRWVSLVETASLAAFVCFGGACNTGSGSGCHYDSWRGTCALRGVRTEKIIERFPQSFVVVEATYEPVSQAGEFSPPPFNKKVIAPAEDEADVTEFLRKQASVQCSVDNPVGDPCAPKMAAAIAEYVPPSTAPTQQGPVGCAKIEHAGDAPTVQSTVKLPGPFQFDANSSGATQAIDEMANEAAKVITENPRIECVAIKAQSAPGEPFTLANERAQTIRRLLEQRGIDRSRVIVFEATAPTYTASPDDQPILAEHRRVHLAVVVYSGDQGTH